MATVPDPPRSVVVDVYANNDLDFKAKKFIVNPRTSSSMEQVIDALSQTLSVIGGVRRLYNVLSGDRVRHVEELYDTKSVVATGKERLNRRLLKAINRKQAAASGGDPLARDIRDAYLVKARKKDSKSFPGAMQMQRPRKYARTKGPRIHGTRDLDRRGQLRQRFEGNPHQVLPPVSAPTEGRQLSSLTEGHVTASSADDAGTKPHSAPSTNKRMHQASDGTHAAAAADSFALPVEAKEGVHLLDDTDRSSATPPHDSSPTTTTDTSTTAAGVGAQAPTPGVLSNRVEYLLAQVSQVERRAALERRRQQASIKRKMTQKLHGGDALLHAFESEQQQRESVLDGERERQQAILREKLRNKPAALVRERIPDSLKEDVEACSGAAMTAAHTQQGERGTAGEKQARSKDKTTNGEAGTEEKGHARANGPSISQSTAASASTSTAISTGISSSNTGAARQVRKSNNHRTERPLRVRPVNTEAAGPASKAQQKATAATTDATAAAKSTKAETPSKAGAVHAAGKRGGVKSRLPQKQVGYTQRHTKGYQQQHHRRKQLRKQQQQQQQQEEGERQQKQLERKQDDDEAAEAVVEPHADDESSNDVDGGLVSGGRDEAVGKAEDNATGSTAASPTKASTAAAEEGPRVERAPHTEGPVKQRKNKAARTKHKPNPDATSRSKVTGAGTKMAVTGQDGDGDSKGQGDAVRAKRESAPAVNDTRADTKDNAQVKRGQHHQQQQQQQEDKADKSSEEEHEDDAATVVAGDELKKGRIPTPVPMSSRGGKQRRPRMSGDIAAAAEAEEGTQGARPKRLSPVLDAREGLEAGDVAQQAAVEGKKQGQGKGRQPQQKRKEEAGKKEGGKLGKEESKAKKHKAPGGRGTKDKKKGSPGPAGSVEDEKESGQNKQQEKQQQAQDEEQQEQQQERESQPQQQEQHVQSTQRNRVATPDLAVSSSMMHLYRTDAAVKIQAAYRGYCVRKALPWRLASQRGKAQQHAEGKGHAKKENALAKKKEKKEKKGKKEQKGRGKPQQLVPSEHGLVDQAYVDERFEVFEKLGDGNFADVYRCKARETGEEYALKIVYKSRLIGKRERAMIANEVAIMRSIDHPHIAKLCDVLETSDRIFLVLELVHGGDLFDRIVERGRFTESDAKRLVRHLAEAVAYLHERSIVHRDLKPENILVAQDEFGRDVLKLGDFGLSMHVDEKIYTICGTPTYVAPEIISKEAVGYGLQVDTWAIGVIMYIMLCGFPPFSSSNKSQHELFDRIRRGAFTFPERYWKDVTPNAKVLIKNLLRVDPKSRLTPQQVLRHAWLKEWPSTAPVYEQDRHVPVVEELLKHFPQKKRWSDAVTKIRSTTASQQQSRVTSAA